MICALHRYELPRLFIERFRPVKIHPREKGLPQYLFDAYGLRFYRHMPTAGIVPAEAVWSVTLLEGHSGLGIVHGLVEDVAGYVVAQTFPRKDDPHCYPLPIRLGYRARISVQALQRLRDDLAQSPILPNADDVIALIEQRIDAYRHPGLSPSSR